MEVCHLYDNITISQHIQAILDVSQSSISLNINELDSLSEYDIYIVELDSTNNEISKNIINLFKDIKNSLIYFIVPKNHNLIFFQLTYILKAKNIITHGQNTNNVVKKILSDFKVSKVVPVVPIVSTCSDNKVIGRSQFLETIKQELSYKDSNGSHLCAITISFQNMQELQQDLTLLELEEHTNATLNYMYKLFDDDIQFIGLDKDFYIILFKNIDFDEIKELALDFSDAVLDNMLHDEYKFFIDMFAIDLSDFGLSEVISTLNGIKIRKLSHEQSQSDYLEHTSKSQDIISEEDVLNDAFHNKTKIKLLNIYNGLVISTPCKIIKQTEDSIYVNFEQLQGVVMNLEQKTVLQSTTFLQDIVANIKIINLKKKVAVLEKFKFLSTNANSRQYARVTTASNMPIAINIDKSTINGKVIDLSIKSMAIQTKLTQRVQHMKGRDVKLTFNIPNYRFDEGYVQLHVDAKVIVILDNHDDTCKAVCDIIEGSDGESIIKEYVYDRQKELIIEVKKMSLLH